MWHLDGKEKAVVFQSRQAGAHVRVSTPIAVTRVLLLCPCNDVVLVLRWTRLWTPLGFCDAAQALWESPDREQHPVSPGSVAVSLTTGLHLKLIGYKSFYDFWYGDTLYYLRVRNFLTQS